MLDEEKLALVLCLFRQVCELSPGCTFFPLADRHSLQEIQLLQQHVFEEEKRPKYPAAVYRGLVRGTPERSL